MGNYRIMIGANVEDIRLEESLYVEGTTTEYPYNPASLPYYYTGIIQQIKDEELSLIHISIAALYGRMGRFFAALKILAVIMLWIRQ